MCSVLPAVPGAPTHQDHWWVFLIELTCIWDPGLGESNPMLSAIKILFRNVLRSFPAPSTFPQLLPRSYNSPLFEMRNILEFNTQLWPWEGLPRYWEIGSNTKAFLIFIQDEGNILSPYKECHFEVVEGKCPHCIVLFKVSLYSDGGLCFPKWSLLMFSGWMKSEMDFSMMLLQNHTKW